MKCISLHQPWATWVAIRWKTIETRTHDRFKRLNGQRIAIHAAKKIDASGLYEALGYLPDNTALQLQNMLMFVNLSRGSIICTAVVSNVLWCTNQDTACLAQWNKQAMCDVDGNFLLFLEDIRMLGQRIPYRGRQGIFHVDINDV